MSNTELTRFPELPSDPKHVVKKLMLPFELVQLWYLLDTTKAEMNGLVDQYEQLNAKKPRSNDLNKIFRKYEDLRLKVKTYEQEISDFQSRSSMGHIQIGKKLLVMALLYHSKPSLDQNHKLSSIFKDQVTVHSAFLSEHSRNIIDVLVWLAQDLLNASDLESTNNTVQKNVADLCPAFSPIPLNSNEKGIKKYNDSVDQVSYLVSYMFAGIKQDSFLLKKRVWGTQQKINQVSQVLILLSEERNRVLQSNQYQIENNSVSDELLSRLESLDQHSAGKENRLTELGEELQGLLEIQQHVEYLTDYIDQLQSPQSDNSLALRS